MQLELKVDAEAVQQRLVQALVDSAVGKQIEKSITELLTKQFGDWNNRETLVESAVRHGLQDELRRLIADVLREKQPELRALIAEKLTTEAIEKATSTMISKLWQD